MRAAAASLLAFTVLGASSQACGGTVEKQDNPPGATGGATGTGGATNTGGHAATGGTGGMTATGGTSIDAGPDVVTPCTPAVAEQERAAVQTAVHDKVQCFSGSISFENGAPTSASFSTGWSGGLVLRVCEGGANQAYLQTMVNNAMAAAATVDTHCIAPPDNWVEIKGNATDEIDSMRKALENSCPTQSPEWYQSQVVVVLNKSGQVANVTAHSGTLPQAIVDCVFKALGGLSFPCLAGTEVCAEYIIAE